MTLSKESKINITLTKDNKVDSPALQDVNSPISDLTDSFDTQGTIWSKETKNNISITLETKS
jgi:hypothetical protein